MPVTFSNFRNSDDGPVSGPGFPDVKCHSTVLRMTCKKQPSGKPLSQITFDINNGPRKGSLPWPCVATYYMKWKSTLWCICPFVTQRPGCSSGDQELLAAGHYFLNTMPRAAVSFVSQEFPGQVLLKERPWYMSVLLKSNAPQARAGWVTQPYVLQIYALVSQGIYSYMDYFNKCFCLSKCCVTLNNNREPSTTWNHLIIQFPRKTGMLKGDAGQHWGNIRGHGFLW